MDPIEWFCEACGSWECEHLELQAIGAQLDRAARHLNPLVIDGDVDTAKAAHDALNALAAARLRLDLLQAEENINSEGAAS